jgi:putative transposase
VTPSSPRPTRERGLRRLRRDGHRHRPDAGVSPAGDAIAERFVGSIRRELLDWLLIIIQRHAAAVLDEYADRYNIIGRAGRLVRPLRFVHFLSGRRVAVDTVRRHDRLAGLLHEYQQET